MQRPVALIFSAAVLVALVASHDALLAAPAPKQLICHVTGNDSAHIIEISTNAVPAHLGNHGDCIINSTDRTLIGSECDPTDANGNDICDVQP